MNSAPPSVEAIAPTLGRRLAAMFYECLLLTGVLFATALPFGVITQTHNALDNRHALQAFLFVVLGIYFTWFWSKGQTLAMKTWHLYLQQVNGLGLTRKKALLRYMFSWVWVLPPTIGAWALGLNPFGVSASLAIWGMVWYGLAQLRKDKQCWHDVVCGTQLVYIKPPTKQTPANDRASSP